MPKKQQEPLDPRSPRLSNDLIGPRHPHRCQGCGAPGKIGDGTLLRHIEHDHLDRPEPVVVVLCAECDKKHIKKHPRLYAPLYRYDNFAGAMELCVNCVWRRGVSCKNPTASRNGGAGVQIAFAPGGGVAFLNFGGGRGGRMQMSPPISCSGQELDEPAASSPSSAMEDYSI